MASQAVNAATFAEQMPAHACDAHLHIYGSQGQGGADVAAYRAMQTRLGTRRAVIVTPRPHGTDNRITLEAIQRLGAADTRGVAVLHPSVSDTELARLHEGGVRGIRFTLYTPTHAVTTADMIEPLAARVAALGWHVQLHMTAEQIAAHREMLKRLPAPIVFDHLARIAPELGTAHPAFATVQHLLGEGRAWIKLSAPYLVSQQGIGAAYRDQDVLARAFYETAPTRMVWGSDWPHVTERDKPTPELLHATLLRCLPEEAMRQRVLVDNPAQLYGFG